MNIQNLEGTHSFLYSSHFYFIVTIILLSLLQRLLQWAVLLHLGWAWPWNL